MATYMYTHSGILTSSNNRFWLLIHRYGCLTLVGLFCGIQITGLSEGLKLSMGKWKDEVSAKERECDCNKSEKTKLDEIFDDSSLVLVSEKENSLQHIENRNRLEFLNDKTLDWNNSVHRLWLDTTHYISDEKPPAMLLLTNIGYNHPDQQNVALKTYRSIRQRELLNAVINHPWFHPTAWQDINERNVTVDPDVRYYVFLDTFTCNDLHYPIYGGYDKNLDSLYNRTTKPSNGGCERLHNCHHITQMAKETRLFKEAYNQSRFIYLDCSDDAPFLPYMRSELTKNWPVTMVSMSATMDRINLENDMGLPPPSVSSIQLTDGQIRDIRTCDAEKQNKRKYLLTYLGNLRNGRNPHFAARAGLREFHDEIEGILVMPEPIRQAHPYLSNISFAQILSETVFGAAPRGDCKYSYRFTEVLAAGTIPVILSDNWVWPFLPELVQWEKCAVILPERDVKKVPDVLRNMTQGERCRRRQYCYEIYQRYTATPEGTINGIIQSLERVAVRKTSGIRRLPLSGYNCKVDDDPDTVCNLI